MDLSLFLAQAFGIYLFVMGLSILFKRDTLIQAEHMLENKAFLWIFGTFPLMLGIILILNHNIWEQNWRLIITLISWSTFLKGVTILLLPTNWIVKLEKWMVELHPKFIPFYAILMVLLGGYLAYLGFGLEQYLSIRVSI
ncbi:hypothetical protein GW950_01365 [Candidatus Wolfebacteria bacterium]|nr:hypothetical protein [Candidatus Wolfebacteria bacterium]